MLVLFVHFLIFHLICILLRNYLQTEIEFDLFFHSLNSFHPKIKLWWNKNSWVVSGPFLPLSISIWKAYIRNNLHLLELNLYEHFLVKSIIIFLWIHNYFCSFFNLILWSMEDRTSSWHHSNHMSKYGIHIIYFIYILSFYAPFLNVHFYTFYSFLSSLSKLCSMSKYPDVPSAKRPRK